MKSILFIFMFIVLLLTFTGCVQNENNETIFSEETSLTQIEEMTEEITTLPPADRLSEEIYKAFPEFTPVDYLNPAILPKSEDMGQKYIDNLNFICDSPTYWMWPFGLLKDGTETKSIWTGPEGTMTLAYQSTYNILDPYDNLKKPIRDVVSEHKPEYLIIAVGINGISFMDEEYFKEEYIDLVADIKELSPDTKLILQSIYPITRAYRYWGDITNVMITKANSWILEIAYLYDCKYLDTFAVLIDSDGYAKDEFMMSDGLHPNKDGLIKVLEYIRTHAYI